MSTPTVSVVVATFRRAALLGEALASVQAQSFTDWECIVADDDGGEETRAVVESFARRDPRFRHERVVGRGGSPARVRNAGVACARGRYLAFLDDDDRWRPAKLALQLEVLERDPGAVAACGKVEEFGARRSIWPGEPIPARFGRGFFVLGNPVATTTVVVPRTVFVDVGGFDERRRLAEDYALWIALAGHGHFRFVDQILADYRVHPGNTSARELDVLDSVEEILRERVSDATFGAEQVRTRLRRLHWRRARLEPRVAARIRWAWKALRA